MRIMRKECLNPCYNGMTIELFGVMGPWNAIIVLILVIME